MLGLAGRPRLGPLLGLTGPPSPPPLLGLGKLQLLVTGGYPYTGCKYLACSQG